MIPPLVFFAALVYAALAGFDLVPHPWPLVVAVASAGGFACGWMSAP